MIPYKRHMEFWTRAFADAGMDADRASATAEQVVEELTRRVMCMTAAEPCAYILGWVLARTDGLPEGFGARFGTDGLGLLGEWENMFVFRPEPVPLVAVEPRHCAVCGADITHRRAEAVTCSTRCRVELHRARAERAKR